MITFTVRMRFAQEDHASIRSILQNLGSASRQEPGCVSYITHFVENDPCTVVIYEQYRDADALEAHRASQHFEQYATNGLYRKVRERSLEQLAMVE
ncbi:MAG: putative quinol monooxygenase [Janthinobacterium lividum]